MAVKVTTGNVLESSAQTLVNTVNCVGVMGKGIALDFKKRFPDMFQDYVARCKRGGVRLGEPYLFKRPSLPWILNFPTKKHWKNSSSEMGIAAGLDYLAEHYKGWGIESLAVPALGCGNGGLDWSTVGPIAFNHLSRLDIPVELFAPPGTPREQLTEEFLAQDRLPMGVGAPTLSKVEPAWVALVSVLARIEDEPYHCPVGRTIFQHVVSFATAKGLPTGLSYAHRGHRLDGKGLETLETRLMNVGLLQEQRLGRTTVVRHGPEYPRAAAALRNQLRQWDALVDSLADLFLRIRDARQAEQAVRVMFAARDLARSRGARPTERDVLDAVTRPRRGLRHRFDTAEIALIVRNLAALDLLDISPSPDLPLPDEQACETATAPNHANGDRGRNCSAEPADEQPLFALP